MKNKFKLPKKIIIGKSEIKIIQKDLSKIYPNKAGYLKPIYKKKFIIYLDSKLENQDIKNTLYHELVHFYFFKLFAFYKQDKNSKRLYKYCKYLYNREFFIDDLSQLISKTEFKK